MTNTEYTTPLDSQSEFFLNLLAEQQKTQGQRFPGVNSVLVVLSGQGMVFDIDSLRQKIRRTYPGALVYFCTSLGKVMGHQAPQNIDLLIDFTAPHDRETFCFSRQLRRRARIAVSRDKNFFRRKFYDRVFFEKKLKEKLPNEIIDRERVIQKAVLALAGIPLAQQGDAGPNLEPTIALKILKNG